jgi:hypothetical protein
LRSTFARSRRRLLRSTIALLGALPSLSASAGAGANGYAEQITLENASARVVRGSDSLGGVGDWALGNGVLCAVISDPDHESNLTPQGGVLIDLARCGVAQDEWVTLEGLVNMSRGQMLGASSIRAEPHREDGSVAIVTGARSLGLEIETTYRLGPDRPHALQIETRATRLPETTDETGRAFLFGEVALHGRRQLAPFTLRLDEAGGGVLEDGSVGFAHPEVDPNDMLTMVRAILPADLHVLVGGDTQKPGVAYGLRLVGAELLSPDGSSTPLPFLAINGESFTMQGVFTRPLFFGGASIGWLELAQTLLMDIEAGETLVFNREILVGKRSDVASVTDQIWSDAPRVRGRVEPGARVHIDTSTGTPVSQVRPDAGGAFSLALPTGSYGLRVEAPADRRLERSFEVTEEGLDLGLLALEPTGRVLLPRGRPMRLVFLSNEGREAPRFDDDLLGYRVGTEAYRGSQYGPDVALGGIPSDPESVQLAPGRYRVIATRGPEFGLTRADLEVAAGQDVALRIDSPERILTHPGWLAADFHVHTEWSDDSNFPVDRQIAAFHAEDADVIVSTEHDRVVDYRPTIERLGLGGQLVSLVGSEVTSSAQAGESPFTAGHSNAFPLPFEPFRYRGGSPRIEGRRLRTMIGDVHALPGSPLVQLNHPRTKRGGSGDLNYFTHLAVAGEPYQPASPLQTPPNQVLLERDPATGVRDLDFDLIELWNGDSMQQFRSVRADWYSLLLQGEYRPAVANSDSHVRAELLAYPRTYVQVPPDMSATAFDESTFIEAVRAGRSYGSSGPLLDVYLVGPDGTRTGLGGLHPGASADLVVIVRSVPWIPVSHLRVLWNAGEVYDAPLHESGTARIPLEIERDGFVTVEVRGPLSADYAAVARGFEPFAFTNPIFVDADGDGSFSAPGLPDPPPPVLDPGSAD